jgi:putative endonuclease
MNRISIGQQGEARARRYFRKNGYQVLAQNYQRRFGEIDLIVEKDRAITFVEVRYRRSIEFGLPQETVIKRKQAKIRKVATQFLVENNIWNKVDCHFDIISIYEVEGRERIEHIRDAF